MSWARSDTPLAPVGRQARDGGPVADPSGSPFAVVRDLAIEATHAARGLMTADMQRVEIVKDVSLTVADGEYVAIVGPSGCGKTVFLNMVAGLEPISGGSIRVRGEAPEAGKKGTAYAFARDGLLPWRTAQGNVELALRLKGIPKRERTQRAAEALERVHLGAYAPSYASQLSQGMRQRVALARTIVSNPSLLLLDEPFAALDAQTRVGMGQLLLEVLAEYHGSVLLITHDLYEAITLADRVILFSSRPARVSKEFEVKIPRPRDVVELRSDPMCQAIHQEMWEHLSEEALAQ
jgi:NitT/TauT family transport system ATP-binding protein